LTVFDKMDTSYEPWKTYHKKKDLLEATHSVIDADGPFDLYRIAIELPSDEKLIQMGKWMNKEVDTATRFSLTDGKIQVEIEVWDEDFEKRLYFACDLTFKQCSRILNGKNFNMGFCPVGGPNITIAAVKMFKREDLADMIKLKQMTDAHPNRPETWKVG